MILITAVLIESLVFHDYCRRWAPYLEFPLNRIATAPGAARPADRPPEKVNKKPEAFLKEMNAFEYRHVGNTFFARSFME